MKLVLTFPGAAYSLILENDKGERRVIDSGRSKHYKIERGIKAAKTWATFLGIGFVSE